MVTSAVKRLAKKNERMDCNTKKKKMTSKKNIARLCQSCHGCTKSARPLKARKLERKPKLELDSDMKVNEIMNDLFDTI